MKSINLIFGCHSHQPVGNFDFVFKEAYEKSYKPFIDVLEKFPSIHVTLHYTGPLWDWFLEHAPEYIKRLRGLVEAGQVEIMGGGYYEPLLCAIPERDAKAQIVRMNQFCEKHFGKPPRGMWLTERVWEPHMAKILAESGIEYTALDDAHFLCSGLAPEELYGYYMTEDEGRTLKVFPIQEKLRYLVPFHSVEETIEYLRDVATEAGDRCAVLHDDGEKFGVWPGTFNSVYEQGWLEDFFTALTENKGWLHAITYAEYLDQAKAKGRTYITCASYEEMMTWALPTDMQRKLKQVRDEVGLDNPERAHRYKQFIRGGFWRGFLSKYAESNNLQKRMLQVSERLKRLKDSGKYGAAALEEAELLLHKAQCNCAYWHGAFGGLYLNHLRTAIYEHAIAADAKLDGVEFGKKNKTRCLMMDFDGDGNDELVLENGHCTAYFSPTDGGTLFELDFKTKPFNFGNTLTRRDEPYHDALRAGLHLGSEEGAGGQSIHEIVHAKEDDLEQFLVYDPWRRVSMRDHLLAPGISITSMGASEPVADKGLGSSEYVAVPVKNGVQLTYSGGGESESNPGLKLSKTVHLAPDESTLQIVYDIENIGDTPIEGIFAVEFGVNLLAGDAPDRYYWSKNRDLQRPPLRSKAVEQAVTHFALRDEWMQLDWALEFEGPTQVFRFPLETVSQSESGQERVYQGSMVIPHWDLALPSGEGMRIAFAVVLSMAPDWASAK